MSRRSSALMPTVTHETAHCRLAFCPNSTAERKPFCFDHLERIPGWRRVRDEHQAREREASAVERSGAGAVDLSGSRARELLWLLEDGALAEGYLYKILDVPSEVLECYLAALELAGRIRRFERPSRRGYARFVCRF